MCSRTKNAPAAGEAAPTPRPGWTRDLDQIHELGARLYPKHWMHANRVAIESMRSAGADPTADNSLKCGVSLVVLRVLDGTVGRPKEAPQTAVDVIPSDLCDLAFQVPATWKKDDPVFVARTAVHRAIAALPAALTALRNLKKDAEEFGMNDSPFSGSVIEAGNALRAFDANAALVVPEARLPVAGTVTDEFRELVRRVEADGLHKTHGLLDGINLAHLS